MSTLLGKIVADFTTNLAAAMAVGATTATLQSATDDDGIALPAGHYFFAIDGNNSQKEHISCDLSGVNLTNIKTLSRQGVEVAGCVRTHRTGSTVTLTDFAHIKYIADLISGTTTLNASTPLGYDGTASITTNNQLATKAYVDGVAVAGAPDAAAATKGITRLSVAAASATIPVAVGDNDYRIVNYFAETGAANAYVITPSPAVSAYAAGQRFSFKATSANTITSTLNVNALGAKSIFKGGGLIPLSPNDIVAGQIVHVEYDGTNFQLQSPGATSIRFGGTGADGALAISSGTTTVNLGNARVYVLNYTSVSITGTAVLAFSNPHSAGTLVIIKSQGNVTLTSSATPMIDCSALGAAAATAPNFVFDGVTHVGATGNAGSGQTAGAAQSTVGLIYTNQSQYTTVLGALARRAINVVPGAGGGTGGAGGNGTGTTGAAGGAGGRGGGALLIECGGALNFTTTNGISVAGAAGSNGSNGSQGTGGGGNSGSGGGGGGGGGAGGNVLILYNILTANTGTINVLGGAGGDSGTGGGVDAGTMTNPGGGGGGGGTGAGAFTTVANASGAGATGGAINTAGGAGNAGGANGHGAGGGSGAGSGNARTASANAAGGAGLAASGSSLVLANVELL